MKSIILILAASALLGGAANAQQYGVPAYPDNWTGGPPLPPVGQTAYVQPQGYYIQPQGYVVRYTQPSASVSANQRYYRGATVVDPYYSPGQGPVAGQVSGPVNARCIVAKLNGAEWPAGCSWVHVNEADYPVLREKFSHYQSGSGYVLNLPSDNDFR